MVKNWKKVLSGLLTLAMVCALVLVPVQAADEDATVKFGNWTKTDAGYELEIVVDTKAASVSMGGAQFNMTFNKDLLVYEGVAKGDLAVSMSGTKKEAANNSGEIKLVYVSLDGTNYDVTNGAVVAKVNFTVKPNAESGSAEFAFTAAGIKSYPTGGGALVESTVAQGANKTADVKGADPTLDTVALDKTSVEVNGTTGDTVKATATSTSNKPITGFVTWSVTPADQGVTVAADGTVTVDAKAKADTYTVTATPKDGESQGTAKTATLTVTRAAAVATTVEVKGDAIIAKPTTGNAEVTYNATVTDQYGDTMADPTIAWTNTNALTGVTVADNKVTVASDAATGEFTLTATVGGKSDTITVKVVDIVFEGVDAGVTVKDAPVYGDTWGDIVKVDASKITAKVGAETVTGTYTVKDAAVAPAAVEGTYEVTFTSTDEAYKDMPVASGKVTVAQKVVTVTANDVSVKVGSDAADITAELGWTATELVGEDKIAGTATYKFFALDEEGNKTDTEVTTIDMETVADYAIVVSGLTVEPAASAGNYDVQFKDGVLTVRKKSLKPPPIGQGTKPDGTIVNPDGTTTKPDGTKIDFVDVADEDWFNEAVDFVVTKGLFKGVSETEFAPNNDMTRAMVATVLFRLDGEHKTDVAAAFEDLAADTWYTDGVAWAAEKGVVKGLSATEFAPDANVTREQLATMLYRYAGEPEVDAAADMAGYADVETVSDWAATAMRWAVENGIIKGKDGARLDPQGNATRAEVATMLQRFVNLEK